MSRFDEAKTMYAALGVDAEAAIEQLKDVCVSVHCWQGDDVGGFDSPEALSGGIQTTGNYPGKARTPAELMADLDKAFSLMRIHALPCSTQYCRTVSSGDDSVRLSLTIGCAKKVGLKSMPRFRALA